MASKVEIMNLALVQLGDEIILSATEDTKAARVMNVIWEPTLKEVLADHTWGFAKHRTTLALLDSTPTYEFTYAYQLPADYIRMVCMGEPDDAYDWRIESNTLVTDEEEADILYVRYISDTAKFSPKFVTALSCLLAARAAGSLAGLDSTKKGELMESYNRAVMDAATVDSQDSPSPIYRPNRWIDARS